MEDQNVIEHLFDVERQAAELMADAQKEYDKRNTLKDKEDRRELDRARKHF